MMAYSEQTVPLFQQDFQIHPKNKLHNSVKKYTLITINVKIHKNMSLPWESHSSMKMSVTIATN